MAFLAKTSRDIGTSATGIGSDATPGAGKTWVIIGMSITNVTDSPVSVTAMLHDPTDGDTEFLHEFPLPVGETVVPEGSLGKIVLTAGQTIKVQSSAAAALDVIMSVLES